MCPSILLHKLPQPRNKINQRMRMEAGEQGPRGCHKVVTGTVLVAPMGTTRTALWSHKKVAQQCGRLFSFMISGFAFQLLRRRSGICSCQMQVLLFHLVLLVCVSQHVQQSHYQQAVNKALFQHQLIQILQSVH